jgi:hypothetical protein
MSVGRSCQVEHLHAVLAGAVGHDVGVVPVHLDVAPTGGPGALGQRKIGDRNRVRRIGHVKERGAVASAEQRPFRAGLRIGPAPDVAHLNVVAVVRELRRRQERHQLGVGALEHLDDALTGAGPLVTRQRRDLVERRLDEQPRGPLAVTATLEDQQAAGPAVQARGAHGRDVAAHRKGLSARGAGRQAGSEHVDGADP